MACIENVIGGHGPSAVPVAADENGNQEPCLDVPLQCPSSIPMSDVGSWGHLCIPVPLRPSFNMLTDLAREQLECPSEGTGSCIPVNNLRALQHPYGPPPAVAEASLATAEVNSSGGLAGLRQRGHDSVNVSQVFSGGPSALMMGGARVSNGSTEMGGNNARLYLGLPRGQGFVPARGPQVRGPPHIPTLRSGIMMELPPGNTRMTYKDRLAHVSFPAGGGPRHPLDTWPRPLSLAPSTPGLPSGPTAHAFVAPQPPTFNPFLPMPIAFAPPPIVGHPQPSYFANYPSWGMPAPSSSNRENK
ncbi:PREDICTED: proline-rich protein 32 [Condylura cristata]|uniref:proline-rich protein 32 n=1 Tax=Condylura cristata TaxID=143302 RepID=UPI000334423E|nr:PREDICTED: proline-rich protein 32 [Condylura cristata]